VRADVKKTKAETVVADLAEMVEESGLASKYWLQEVLEPLNKKELKAVVDGILIQLVNEEQAKKIIKFAMLRFPNYYKEGFLESKAEAKPKVMPPSEKVIASIQAAMNKKAFGFATKLVRAAAGRKPLALMFHEVFEAAPVMKDGRKGGKWMDALKDAMRVCYEHTGSYEDSLELEFIDGSVLLINDPHQMKGVGSTEVLRMADE